MSIQVHQRMLRSPDVGERHKSNVSGQLEYRADINEITVKSTSAEPITLNVKNDGSKIQYIDRGSTIRIPVHHPYKIKWRLRPRPFLQDWKYTLCGSDYGCEGNIDPIEESLATALRPSTSTFNYFRRIKGPQ
jgi:hypothetical protein